MTLPFDMGFGAAAYMAVAVLVAAFVRGYSGFGYSAMVITASSVVTNPLNFVAVVVIAETVMTLQSWSGLSSEVDWRRVKWLLMGAMIGMPLGLWALSYVSEDGARAVVSVYVLTMCLVLLAGFKLAQEAGGGATFATGIVSGLANAPGMGGLPVAAFFAAQPMAPAVFRATVVAYFPCLDIFSAPLYWMAGLVTWDTLWASLIVLPLTLLGNWLGGRHFFNTDPQDFRRFAILLLAALAALGLGKALVSMLLVVNAGSSSLKLAVFDAGLAQVAQARAERIGTGGLADHGLALQAGLAEMGIGVADLQAAAHRVVHGGAGLTRACRITPEVEAEIAACATLAPLHNPANLTGIRALAALAPDLPQFASFDTAFHATNPPLATTYALPLKERERALRRYGFHGLSYAAIVRKVNEITGNSLPNRLLVFHLGNGASACAILNGQSVASTMGYSPLDGLTMGTRGGSLDPAVVLDLAARHGVEGAARLLNRESGLVGLAGVADMRALHAAGTDEAAFAVDHFAYWAARAAGSLLVAMGGLDAVVFTGGIGENDKIIRGKILEHVRFAGVSYSAVANAENAPLLSPPDAPIPVRIIPADEERQIAIEALALMGA